MNRKTVLLASLSAVIFLFSFSSPAFCQQGESITLTTYYPSPAGIYNKLRSKKMAIGDTYYDPSQYCWDPNSSCSSSNLEEETSLIVEGNVGIGTTESGGKLSVSGGTTPAINKIFSDRKN